jgi:hypothetical protein
MDVLYVGGIIVFTALTIGLIKGCEVLRRRATGGRP